MGAPEQDLARYEAQMAREDAADAARDQAIDRKVAMLKRMTVGDLLAEWDIMVPVVVELAEQIVDAEADKAAEDHRKGLDL